MHYEVVNGLIQPRQLNYAERRLLELESLGRELTDAEQCEAMLRARQARRHAARRGQYHSDPEYQATQVRKARDYRARQRGQG